MAGKIFRGLPASAARSQKATLLRPITLDISCDPSTVQVLPKGTTSSASYSGVR